MTAAPVVGSPRGYRLRVGDPRALTVSVTRSPHLSLVSMLVCTKAAAAPGLPGRVARRAQASVRRPGRFALASLLGPPHCGLPEIVSPIPPTVDVSVAEQAQRLRDLPGTALQADLLDTFGADLPPWWRPAADRPRRWLDSFAAASLDAWAASSRAWRRAQSLLDRETRRVGTAVVRGGTDALLNNLHPRISYRDGEVGVRVGSSMHSELAGRRLVLVPMICAPDGVVVSFELSEVVYLGYAVRGLASLGNRAPLRDLDGDPLVLVLGQLRAQLLRAACRPTTVGRLADAVRCAPNTVSYHCTQLEAAGLIVRERRGQSVWVSRTTRGYELVELLCR